MRKIPRSRLLLWGSAALVLLIDQLVKLWVVLNLPEQLPVDVFPWLHPILSFTYLKNSGVAFGLFPQFGDAFTLLALVVVGAIIFFQHSLPLEDWMLHLALGLQVGGALGNLADRLFRGAVVDFLDVNFWPLRTWPVFNVADSAIVVGVVVLFLSTLLEQRQAVSEDVAA